jgi:hypothetical protein
VHVTPTSSSWLNLVERWFREITEKRIRRGSFASVPELIAAIQDYLAASNDNPRPFVWHASVQSILDKIAKSKAIFETLHWSSVSPISGQLRGLEAILQGNRSL